MADLSQEFAKEKDLSDEFAKEQDLSQSKSIPSSITSVPDVSQFESILRGGAQGATLGFADELQGAGQALIGSLSGEEGSLGEKYHKYRDLARQQYEAAEKANPKSYMGGELASFLIPGTLLGKAAKGGLKGAQIASKVLNPETLTGMAGLGATAGLGSSTAELASDQPEIGKAANAAAIGAGAGLAGGIAGKAIGGMLSPETAEQMSSRYASKAAGIKEIPGRGIGKSVLESGILEGDKTAPALLEKLQPALDNTESKLQDLLGQVKDKIPSTDLSGMPEIGDKAELQVLKLQKNYSKALQSVQDEIGENIVPDLNEFVNALKKAGNNPIELNNIKRGIDQSIKWIDNKFWDANSRSLPQDKRVLINSLDQLRGTVRNHIEELGDAVGDDLGQQVKTLNSNYGNLLETDKQLSRLVRKPESDLDITGPLSLIGSAVIHPVKTAAKVAGGLAAGSGELNLGLAKSSQAIGKVLGEVPAGAIGRVGAKSAAGVGSMEEAPEGDSYKKAKQMYQADDNTLTGFAQKAQNVPELKDLSQGLLKAIANKDNMAKNAALFSLAQKTQARKLFFGEQ